MSDLQTIREALEGWANHDQWLWPETALEQAKRNNAAALVALSRLEDAYEQGRQDGMKQEHAMWKLARLGQEIEAAAVPELSRDDVVRLAREAGCAEFAGEAIMTVANLERFASLVRSVPVGGQS